MKARVAAHALGVGDHVGNRRWGERLRRVLEVAGRSATHVVRGDESVTSKRASRCTRVGREPSDRGAKGRDRDQANDHP